MIYRTHLHAVSRSASRPPWAAGDLAASVFSYLYIPDKSGRRRIGSYWGSGSLGNWLGTVARNLAAREWTANHGGYDSLDSAAELADQYASPENSLGVREVSALISAALIYALRKLKDRERRVLTLRYWDQLQVSQIARDCCVQPSSITRQLDRTLSKLNAVITDFLTSRHHLSPAEVKQCIDEIIANPAYSVLTELPH